MSRIFWGEMHHNTHQVGLSPEKYDEVLSNAASHLDFYAAAYYTACSDAFRSGGHPTELGGKRPLVLEGWKPAERIEREWTEVQAATARRNEPGKFVTFPGYEWQGDGSSGDHNVFYLKEGPPVFRVNRLAELYECLRGKDAIAIPHHVWYRPGLRGRDWSVFDEKLSPFCEIFSVHGCSEVDEEYIGLRVNSHMGPGFGCGSWQHALDMGLHIGAICSTDGWDDMPAHYGRGIMACIADGLTRESLWKAFLARRVYGATGDRIELDFRIGEALMGDIVAVKGPRRIRVRVAGLDALDRIELLRNGRVIATHCHQGTWDLPRAGKRARFKIRIEAGWGPRPNEMDPITREWSGEIRVDGGRMLGFQPCWISPCRGEPELKGGAASFRMITSTLHVAERHQNANVFEFEADPAAEMLVRMNGLEERGKVAEFAACSREMWFRDECIKLLAEKAGVAPMSPERMDVYHHCAFKVKIHRPIPAAGYEKEWEYVDKDPLRGAPNYRLRVEPRNGQRAWSSPIWVRPAGTGRGKRSR
ncbi:MAG: hypothetical protein N3A38_15745 [Planctomycetota bacterium]|nr:hypothetical protein [Planctomycetota bacterium]